MTQKIQGKFYPLKSEEWLDSINKLTHSELKILYYVRSLDPYNNGIDLTPAQIARDLSTDKNKMHRSTVGRALKSLDRKGFINLELIKVRIKVNPRGFLNDLEAESESKSEAKNNVVATQPCCDHATNVVTTQHSVQPRNIECAHTTQSASTQQSKAETQSEQKVENPKIHKTYLDFKKTLSESERENFLSFVEEKINNLEKPINDLEAWLASKNAAEQNRWEIYYKNYQEEKASQNLKTTRQGNNQGNYSPSKMERAIAEFKRRRGINQPIDEPESKSINSEKYRQREAEFNKLLDNPPEREVRKSPAQQRREKMAEARRQQEAIKRANREAAEERAKREQQLSIEERRAEMLRQLEEFDQRQSSQNPEIDEEGLENE